MWVCAVSFKKKLPHPNRVNLLLAEGFGQIKGDPIPHDIVTSPTQLVRHRFDGHHPFALGFLSLIVTLNPGVELDSEVGRLHKRPGKILIAVLGVALAFAFAVADLLTAYTATVRSKVSHTGKSPDVSGLKHDGERENLPDPRHRLKKAELRSKLDSLCDGSLQDLGLFIGAAHHRQVSLDRQGEIPVGQKLIDLLDIEPFDLVGAQRTAGVAGHQILDA